ncbi:hypothetical protein IU11_07330 [Cellulosimicrobium sp. MM]|nr:hypothetical protein IU11_07330 [Cellulosimicrobium sp. MM]
MGGRGEPSMREMRFALEFDPPGTSNGVRPASSVYVVAASAQTSVAMPLRGGSANDSGGDHGIDMPSARAASSTVDEMPKSVSAGCPYSVTRMFAGLMSRCRIPARCAVSTAPAIWTAVRSASATGSRSVR